MLEFSNTVKWFDPNVCSTKGHKCVVRLCMKIATVRCLYLITKAAQTVFAIHT